MFKTTNQIYNVYKFMSAIKCQDAMAMKGPTSRPATRESIK